MSEDFSDEIASLKEEIASLKRSVSVNRTPWYSSATVLISALALCFSFGTTMVSLYRSSREDVRSARSELRGILQRISSLPKENFELTKKYRDDPEGLNLTGYLAEENSLLARQAEEIINRFPDEISPGEYFAVGNALRDSGDEVKFPLYMERAIKSSNPLVKGAALRTLGRYLMVTGSVKEGREKYENTLAMLKDFPDTSAYLRNTEIAHTEMFWAQTEFEINEFEAAKIHIEKAAQTVAQLPANPSKAQLQRRILHARNIIERAK